MMMIGGSGSPHGFSREATASKSLLSSFRCKRAHMVTPEEKILLCASTIDILGAVHYELRPFPGCAMNPIMFQSATAFGRIDPCGRMN